MTNGEIIEEERENKETTPWVGIMLVCIIVGGFAYLFSLAPEEQEQEEFTGIPIYSVNIGQGIGGEFVLGCGNINSEMHYYFFVSRDDGLILRKVKAEETVIKESDGAPYYINNYGWGSDILVVPINTTKLEYNIDIGRA